MTISVLMSVYKSEEAAYLDRSLKSVWDDQTLKPAQIVLVEDGPLGDDLLAVVDKWKNQLGSLFCVCKNEVNLGLTKSLNIGLAHVTSSLVARADSDDISAPQRFELQSKFLEIHPDIDVVGGSIQEFDHEHDCLNIRHYPIGDDDVRKYIVKASPLAHPAVMMRMEMFGNGLKYDERYRMSQDIQLWFDVLLSGYKISNVSDIVLKFRREGNVFKRRSRVKAKNEFIIYMRGIYRLKGMFTLAYRYPIARFFFRIMPIGVVRFIYNSKLREKILH
jgi:glycosyltransferase involved in cell wall biosynthesis